MGHGTPRTYCPGESRHHHRHRVSCQMIPLFSVEFTSTQGTTPVETQPVTLFRLGIDTPGRFTLQSSAWLSRGEDTNHVLDLSLPPALLAHLKVNGVHQEPTTLRTLVVIRKITHSNHRVVVCMCARCPRTHHLFLTNYRQVIRCA